MSEDARFEDADGRPLRLIATDSEDLQVISSLVQDSVFSTTELSWKPTERRFALLVNRFRWEDQDPGRQPKRAFERVRSVLVFKDVTKVQTQGFDRAASDLVMSLLSIGWEAGADGTGRLVLTLSGDGAIALDTECVNVTLQDVTKPYAAPSGKAPQHPDA